MDLKTFSNNHLILSLIKAELKSHKLIKGLENAGALTEDFYSDLDWSILELIGFKNEKERSQLFKVYDNFMDNLEEITVSEFNHQLPELAQQLYIDLLAEKKVINRLKDD